MTTIAQRSFTGGELAPSLYSRVDQQKYATGLRTLRNCLIMRHGGATSRPGTKFVAEVKDSTKAVRLIEFIFNSDQTYILEFGDQYMRVHKNGVQLTDVTKTITGISNANPAVVTSNAHGLSNGQEVTLTGIAGALGTYLNGRNFKVAGSTANNFQLQYMNGTAVDSTSFGAYTSGGTASRVYEISTPYALADLNLLKYVQSADVITIVHPGYAPRKLSRTGHTSWTLSTITFAPSIVKPGSPSMSGGTAGVFSRYVITAVNDETGEESADGSYAPAVSSKADTTNPITVTWTASAGATSYRVYRGLCPGGTFREPPLGLLAVVAGPVFVDDGTIPVDYSIKPPVSRNPFPGANDYPSTVNYVQQRLMLANTNNNTEKCFGSQTGRFYNFMTSTPIQDDDAVTFSLAGRQVNAIKHILDLSKMVLLTSSGELGVEGNADGVVTPSAISLKNYSYYGASDLAPLIIGDNALFVQARGSIVRDLGWEIQSDSYKGNDLTIFSAHLFDKYSILSWSYQQTPHSIVWAVRSDGTMLGLTYVKEQNIAGWHRHDTDGVFECVRTVPEGTEDVNYVVVKRTVNGATKRYIERMDTRKILDIRDFLGMDCALTYDGRNTDSSRTMTLSGGTTWDHDEALTLTSSFAYFASTDVGKSIFMNIVNSKTGLITDQVRCTITGYTSSTVVTVNPHKTVPIALRSAATYQWVCAVSQVTGLWHLEGKSVAVTGDGFVVASPNNAAYVARTVTNGTLTLDKPYGVIHGGLPYFSDLETLNVDTAQGQTIANLKKLVNEVAMDLEESRGIWVGPKPPSDDSADPLEGLVELKLRNNEGYDQPTDLATGLEKILIEPQWNSNGRVFIRQVDPIPMTILSIIPSGMFPFR